MSQHDQHQIRLSGWSSGWRRPASVGAGILSLWLASCSDGYADLVRVDTEKEANQILTVLATKSDTEGRAAYWGRKTPVERQRKTYWQVSVPGPQLNGARAVLVEHNLPRDARPGLASLASEAGLIPSRSDERAKLMGAIAGELERTLETIDGVVSARVHIVLPERDALLEAGGTDRPGGAGRRASASVLLRTNVPKLDLRSEAVSGVDAKSVPAASPELNVRELVRGAVDGIEPNDIVVQVNYVPGLEDPKPVELTWAFLLSSVKSKILEPAAVAVWMGGLVAVVLVIVAFRWIRSG